MDIFRIEGGVKLNGEVKVNGAKNASLPIMAAAILAEGKTVLKSVPDLYFLEFFEDFLLRKMMVEPIEYVYWPPALKLFYRFLHEKGYLDNQEDIIREIDKLEPYFIEVLRKQFS